jgi:hypothetical protein
MNLPALLAALGDLVSTDIPTDRLPGLAAVADEMAPGAVVRAVIQRPLIKPGGLDPLYGFIQVPDLEAIRAVSKTLFPPPGEMPQPWPTPTPTPTSTSTSISTSKPTPTSTSTSKAAATAGPQGTTAP